MSSIFLETGDQISIISVGNVLSLAKECREELNKRDIQSDLVSMHTIKPIDENLLIKLFNSNKLIVVIEEHSLIGGAGASILEWANKKNYDTRKLLRFGGPDHFLTGCGNQSEARELIGYQK